MPKYIDLRTDFGFKHCMQDEIVMLSFLNAILDGETDKITKVHFENVEYHGENNEQRGVIFDLLCTTENDTTILIEMQNASQKFFKTRSVYYTTNLLHKHIKKGDKWGLMKHDIPQIIGIFIMGEDSGFLKKVITRTSEFDRDDKTEFWDRIHKYFISLPKFDLSNEEFTIKSIWMETLKNLGKMENIDPSVYERADEGLLRLIKKAEIGALTPEEYNQYEAGMKLLADEIDPFEHGYERGMERGMEKGIKKGTIFVAQNMIKNGFSTSEIARLTDLSKEEIDKLKK